MSERKSSAGFGEREAARAPRDAAPFLGSTADPGTPLAARPVRSGARQGFLRRRIHRRHQGPQVAPDRRGRLAHPLQSGASRRGRRRPAHGRRRRHPGADPAQVFRQESRRARLQAAEAGRIRRRLSVHAARHQLAADHPRHLRRSDRARRADAARLARRADRQFDARRIGQADRADAHAGVHRPRQEEILRGRVRAPALHPAQVDLQRDLPAPRAAHLRLLPGVDLLPHGDLQGHVPGRPARHLLSRSARSGFRERARAGAPALLDQHLPDLVAGASVPLHRA